MGRGELYDSEGSVGYVGDWREGSGAVYADVDAVHATSYGRGPPAGASYPVLPTADNMRARLEATRSSPALQEGLASVREADRGDRRGHHSRVCRILGPRSASYHATGEDGSSPADRTEPRRRTRRSLLLVPRDSRQRHEDA